MIYSVFKHALLALAFAASVYSIPAHSQAQPTPVFSPVYTPAVSGNTYTFGPQRVTASNASSFTFGPAANGGVYGAANNATSIGGGRVANVVVKSAVSKAGVAKAIVTAAAALNPYVSAGVVGYSIYQLLKEFSITRQDDPANPDAKFNKLLSGGCPLGSLRSGNAAPACTPEAACANDGMTWYPQDNMCETSGRQNYLSPAPGITEGTFETKTVAQVEDLLTGSPTLATSPIQDSPNLDSAIKDAVTLGQPVDLPSPMEITGPSSLPSSPPTVVTHPDGSKTTTTASTDIAYSPNSITVNDRSTVVETSPTGAQTGTTTTVAPTTPDKPAPDPCEAHPERIGCSAFGTPTPETVTKTTQAVTVTATAFASTAGCPAPLSFTVHNAQYAVSYSPMCDRLQVFRALFLAMAGVLAAYIFADSFRV